MNNRSMTMQTPININKTFEKGAFIIMTTEMKPDKMTGRKLGDVNVIAKKCDCSSRHIYRLTDAGRMPAPVRLGALVRWDLEKIDRWIADGCPSCRKGGGRK